MFNTEQELLAQIKGWEYIIAISFLVLFILFWWMLSRERKRRRLARATPMLLQKNHQRPVASTGESAYPRYVSRIQPCWEARQCPPEARERCPGYVLSPLPCWVARGLVSEKRSELCTTCPVYLQGMERLVEAVTSRSKGDTHSQTPAA